MGRLKSLKSSVKTLDQATARALPTTGDKKLYGTPQWMRLIARIKRARGASCEDPNCIRPDGPHSRLYGDHVIELRDGGAPLEASNIKLRCPSCHTLKTNRERVKRIAAPIG